MSDADARAPGEARRPRAVALKHRPETSEAPQVVAKGEGDVAQRILSAAREHGVPVREDRDLLELLARCEVGATIPVELFDVVARLLAHLYRLNLEARDGAASRTAPR